MIIRLLLTATLLACFAQAQSVVDYDIVYVRAPRFGDTTYVRMPEVFEPTTGEPGTDLMLLHPNGTEEVLFAAGNGAVLDPSVSFDAKWVFFSYIPDMRDSARNYQRRFAATGGADIYKINVTTRQVVRLTNQEWTPAGGATKWSTNPVTQSSPDAYYLGYGIFNLGPYPLPGGRVVFVSSRDGYLPNKGFSFPNLRLYVMDDDGRNVEPVGHLNIGSALHPTVLMDGRVMFSSWEGEGMRDERNWALWAIWPDGRKWEPLMSAFSEASAFHFQTQLSDGRLAVVDYYNLNNNGFGTLLAFPALKPPGAPPFGSPVPGDPSNTPVRRGLWYFDPSHPAHLTPRYKQYPFSPPSLLALSGFTHGEDEASSRALDGSWAGKVTHPSGAPGNDVLLSWTPGPANNLNRPTTLPRYDGGIYLLKAGVALDDHKRLVLVKNSSSYNELQPRAVVPYQRIYGISEPANLSWLPNDGTESGLLPPGTPFGLVGSSSFYHRNTTPGIGNTRFNGLDPFNTTENGASSNWFEQGSDAGKYTNQEIHAVRLVAMEGASHRSYGPRFELGFRGHGGVERFRILGEIPLRKTDAQGNPVLDPQGNPDTSFLVKIPADTPFTFQTIDKDGVVLNNSQTWHQLRPGEVRTNCGGCHAHNRLPLDFSQTAAARAGYQVREFVNRMSLLAKDAAGNTIVRDLPQRAVDLEYYRDIKPILQRSCVPCHSQASGNPPMGLVLDDAALVQGIENTWHRLANDQNAQFGIKPVIASRTWRQTNASRYIRMFQSRRSLLMWKIMGRRLDGWLNSDHPTETTPGNAATLPAGANPNDADIDFTGTQMPPPSSGIAPLSGDEKMTIARWIDLGCPVSIQDPALSGWFADELKPVLTVSSPRAGTIAGPVQTIRIGAYDSYSGLNRAALSVTANFAINGRPAGSELGPLFAETGDHVFTLAVNPAIATLSEGTIRVRVRDNAGNESGIDRTFRIGGTTPPDTTPPTVSVTAPAAGAVISGQQVTLAASASDNVKVEGVQFRVDGQPVGTERTAAPYTLVWNSTSVADGTHRVTAVARDTAGNTAVSADVSITVRNNVTPPDTTPPTVSVTAPAAGAVISGQQVTLAASASDNVKVEGVQFRVDGQPVGTERTAAPYTLVWNSTSVADGTHRVTAVARDTAGNTAVSADVSVTVRNTTPPSDTTPPAVILTRPTANSVMRGRVLLTATATDNVRVAGVRFLVDGQLVGTEDTASPYWIVWNTASVADGPHRMRAVARDAAGNVGSSAEITVTVRNQR